jgi:hypothetical protein
MFLAAAFALWKGWHLHGNRALFAFALAGLAIAMGAWHLTRRPSNPRP